MRPDCQHHELGRAWRAGADRICRGEGRAHQLHTVVGAGAGAARDHLERRGPRADLDRLFRKNNPAESVGEQRYTAMEPMRRLGDLEEIAAAVVFLLEAAAGSSSGRPFMSMAERASVGRRCRSGPGRALRSHRIRKARVRLCRSVMRPLGDSRPEAGSSLRRVL